MSRDDSLLDYLAGGGKLDSPDNATPRYRAEIMRLMAVFVDSEMAGASGFADCINLAPGLKERIVATRIVLEKFGHASRVLELMEPFGANIAQYVGTHPWSARLDRSVDLGTRRIDGDMRLNVFHYPINGWVDAVTMNYLMGRASVIQVDELTHCSYQPFADLLKDIVPNEAHHAALGLAGLEDALNQGHDPVSVQASVNYWFPRVATTFGRSASDHLASQRRFGLRRHSNPELLHRWVEEVSPVIESLKLQVPELPGQTP